MATLPGKAVFVSIAVAVVAAGPAHADEQVSRQQLAANRVACERALSTCDPVLLLSRLERRAIDRVLRGDPALVLDRAPAGKPIAAIRVVNQDVFGPGEGFLRWFNIFHWTTRETAVRRELSLGVGEPWDQLRLDESARRLRDPVSTSLVAFVPLQAPGGQVELLIVTRDVWSLRANSSWEIQEQQITKLQLALSENNLFGMRKLLSLSFRMDQGSYFVGPVYIDKNVAGTHLDLRMRGGPLFNRKTSDLEGSESVFDLALPLWSLDTRWGGGVAWSHRIATERSFVGSSLKGYVCGTGECREATVDDDPSTVVPHEYRQKRMSLAASVVRAFGDDAWQQRVRGIYELAVQRPALVDDFPDDPVVRNAFRDGLMPPSERTSTVYVGGEVFEPRYRNLQNVGTFELAEDARVGLSAELRVGAALRLIGSESNFLRVTASTGYADALGPDGLWAVSVAGTTRIEGGRTTNTVVEGTARVVAPTMLGFGRFVSQLRVSSLTHDTQNDIYTLGGDTGLRGFPIGYFTSSTQRDRPSDRRVLWNTEFRTRPVPVLFLRVGAVAFYDIGGVAEDFRQMQLQLHHDVGIGLRTLLPQLQPDVFRMDLAVALDGPLKGGFRFSAGYDQLF